jgi:hypothetical protein
MKPEDLRRQLAELADTVGPAQADPLQKLTQRVNRRRALHRKVIGGMTALVVAAAVVGLVVRRSDTTRRVNIHAATSSTVGNPQTCSTSALGSSPAGSSPGETFPTGSVDVPNGCSGSSKLTLPTTVATVAPTTSSLVPVTSRPLCTVETVTVTARIGPGLTGGGASVQVDLAARQSCVLDRMPQIAVVQADGAVVTDATAYQPVNSPGSQTLPISQPLAPPITLVAGQIGEVDSYWYDVCAPVMLPLKVSVALDGGKHLVVAVSGGQDSSKPPQCISSATTLGRLPSGTLVLTSPHVLGAGNGTATSSP